MIIMADLSLINSDSKTESKSENKKVKSAFGRIHLGKNGTVHVRDIIGFFDLDGSTESEITKEFLKKSEKEYKIVNLLYDLPKSFVITSENGRENVYMLSNSVETEIKRMGEN